MGRHSQPDRDLHLGVILVGAVVSAGLSAGVQTPAVVETFSVPRWSRTSSLVVPRVKLPLISLADVTPAVPAVGGRHRRYGVHNLLPGCGTHDGRGGRLGGVGVQGGHRHL